jgi:hypothetical protein
MNTKILILKLDDNSKEIKRNFIIPTPNNMFYRENLIQLFNNLDLDKYHKKYVYRLTFSCCVGSRYKKYTHNLISHYNLLPMINSLYINDTHSYREVEFLLIYLLNDSYDYDKMINDIAIHYTNASNLLKVDSNEYITNMIYIKLYRKLILSEEAYFNYKIITENNLSFKSSNYLVTVDASKTNLSFWHKFINYFKS